MRTEKKKAEDQDLTECFYPEDDALCEVCSHKVGELRPADLGKQTLKHECVKLREALHRPVRCKPL